MTLHWFRGGLSHIAGVRIRKAEHMLDLLSERDCVQEQHMADL